MFGCLSELGKWDGVGGGSSLVCLEKEWGYLER